MEYSKGYKNFIIGGSIFHIIIFIMNLSLCAACYINTGQFVWVGLMVGIFAFGTWVMLKWTDINAIFFKWVGDIVERIFLGNNIETVTCVGCGKEVTENGYCEVNGDAYGDCCWSDHVNDCNKCAELNL